MLPDKYKYLCKSVKSVATFVQILIYAPIYDRLRQIGRRL